MEKLGFVLPRRNGPHSGCPTAPHPGRVVGERGEIGEPDRLVRPAERLGHRLGHGDDQRREHERRPRWRQLGAGAVVDDAGPCRRRRRPDHRWLTVGLGVRPALRDQRRRQARRHAARTYEDAALVDLGAVGAVELLGELGQEGDLLAADGHVDDDAVAGVGVTEIARLRVVVTTGIVVVVARAGHGEHDEGERAGDRPPHVASPHNARKASIVEAEGTGWAAVDASPHAAAESASAAIVATASGTDVPSGTASTASTHMVGSG